LDGTNILEIVNTGMEVGSKMQNDENMEGLYKQYVGLLSPGSSFVMGEFSRLKV
jgi:hypothetical protein